jgi:hypothetical protein
MASLILALLEYIKVRRKAIWRNLDLSNLIIVKQEIFLSDVTTCFNSLKKMVQELRSVTSDTQLQMAQPCIRSNYFYGLKTREFHIFRRPGALTLLADPRSAFIMDFDNLVAVCYISIFYSRLLIQDPGLG